LVTATHHARTTRTSAQLDRPTDGATGGTERAVSDVKMEQKQRLSRQEIARFVAALAEGLGDDGRVKVRLGSSTVELSVASQVDCELEVAVDGDEVELELELKWSISGRPSSERAQDEFEADEFGEARRPRRNRMHGRAAVAATPRGRW
jgi:amphi-Trp domain-containing protein